MAALPAAGRSRNAAATRQAILDAARGRFAAEGYDGASLRDIAAAARVDAALVSRYFGGKEELFIEVLNSMGDPTELFEGPIEEFGDRVARMLLYDPHAQPKMECVLVMLRSAASTQAADAIRHSSRENFYAPFEAYLGGPDAALRARLAGAMIMGVSIAREIDDDLGLPAMERIKLCRRLAEVLQKAVDP